MGKKQKKPGKGKEKTERKTAKGEEKRARREAGKVGEEDDIDAILVSTHSPPPLLRLTCSRIALGRLVQDQLAFRCCLLCSVQHLLTESVN
jgi:hypothetical protein